MSRTGSLAHRIERNRSSSPWCPIDCFAGRSVQAKRNLYTEIVDRLAALGIPRDHVLINLNEIQAENWGIRGGQAACDVDLGFDVHV